MIRDPNLVAAITEMARVLQATGMVLEKLLMTSAASIEPPIVCASKTKAETTENPLEDLPVRWSKINSDWAQIGGRHFVPPSPEAFLSAAYKAAYRPGRWRGFYVGECDGLKNLSRKFMLPINKVSTTDVTRLTERLRENGNDEYAAVYLAEGHEIRESGFKRWRTICPPQGLQPSPNGPVQVMNQCLALRMPDTMSDQELDERFDELVRLGSLGAWLDTDAGRLHCQKVGVSPYYGQRFTGRPYGREIAREQSQEIVAFRTRSDFSRLVAIIERVVLEHLGLFGA